MRRIQCSVVGMIDTKETSQLKGNYMNDALSEGNLVWTNMNSM